MSPPAKKYAKTHDITPIANPNVVPNRRFLYRSICRFVSAQAGRRQTPRLCVRRCAKGPVSFVIPVTATKAVRRVRGDVGGQARTKRPVGRPARRCRIGAQCRLNTAGWRPLVPPRGFVATRPCGGLSNLWVGPQPIWQRHPFDRLRGSPSSLD